VDDWKFAQTDPTERLARLHHFSMTKRQADGNIDFVITVREYVTPDDPSVLFFAQADKQTNQKTAPYTPCGWGRTMLTALAECMKAIHRFPYEGGG
jgi:hypothetical protein